MATERTTANTTVRTRLIRPTSIALIAIVTVMEVVGYEQSFDRMRT
jgi:hypothetical protein